MIVLTCSLKSNIDGSCSYTYSASAHKGRPRSGSRSARKREAACLGARPFRTFLCTFKLLTASFTALRTATAFAFARDALLDVSCRTIPSRTARRPPAEPFSTPSKRSEASMAGDPVGCSRRSLRGRRPSLRHPRTEELHCPFCSALSRRPEFLRRTSRARALELDQQRNKLRAWVRVSPISVSERKCLCNVTRTRTVRAAVPEACDPAAFPGVRRSDIKLCYPARCLSLALQQ
ncbi:hypothetical protein OH77DRAFT_1244388 [Trametes cingulata]|nr:hypothetical protein OH77DRAFT_1244388 [Trametes cingulata]